MLLDVDLETQGTILFCFSVLGFIANCGTEMKEEKIIFKNLAGFEPHIFGILVRRVNHYTTRTNHAGNAASECNV